MLGLNEYIHTSVLTQRGVIDVSDLFPGDSVIEYRTGKLIKVLHTVKREVQDIYKLEFSDGRTMNVSSVDKIFTGKEIVPIMDMIRTNWKIPMNIPQYPTEVQNTFHAPLFPDPYIGGILIMYGRYDDEYINLPMDREQCMDLFSYKYNIELAEKIAENTVYFRWKNAPEEVPIRWREFFPHYHFFAVDRSMDTTIFPHEYQYGSIKTREQVIMGIFDMGYTKEMFPHSISIAHKEEFRLREVQKILWSLGILNKITFDPNLPSAQGREFRLDILGGHMHYPGFFYDIAALEHTIIDSLLPHPFPMKVVKCEKITRGWMYNIVLPKPGTLYLDNCYLPRVAV